MKRTYLALAGVALAGAAAPALPPTLVARGANLFESRPVDTSRFAVLANPVGVADWTLVVLEQLRGQPSCWRQRSDGLVEPSLNNFDFTGICSRYIDSNGYSLRTAEEDLAASHRLRLQQVGSELQLQASSPEQAAVLVVGRAPLSRRDRNGFVPLRLEPGWDLTRRVFNGRSLNHIYFANAASLGQLVAEAGGDSRSPSVALGVRMPVSPLPPVAPPALSSSFPGRQVVRSGPPLRAESRLSRALGGVSAAETVPEPEVASPVEIQRQPMRGRAQGRLTPAVPLDIALPGRAIALQVIPYRE